jgi:hypothetical protein
MHLQSIPRGTLPARLTCIDLLSRLESSDYKTLDMKHAVGVVSRYMLDPDADVSDSELAECLALVEKLYAP